MKLHIPTKQEKESNSITNEASMGEYIITSSGIVNSEEKENENIAKNYKVNINTATQAQLESIPGIGPSTAMKIINYRKEKGKFKNIEDIKEVSGIGEVKFEKMKEYISVN